MNSQTDVELNWIELSQTRFCCMAFGLMLLTGCSSGTPLGELSGSVHFDGQPLTDGNVLVISESLTTQIACRIDENGSFHAETEAGDGVPPGVYRFAVSPPSPPLTETTFSGTYSEPLAPMVPNRYRDPSTSGLKLEIKAGKNPPFQIEMSNRLKRDSD